MKRFSRRYEVTEEFLSRQTGFPFAIVTDTVMKIARSAKKAMWSNFDKWLKAFRSVPVQPKAEQLKLNLLPWMAGLVMVDALRGQQ